MSLVEGGSLRIAKLKKTVNVRKGLRLGQRGERAQPDSETDITMKVMKKKLPLLKGKDERIEINKKTSAGK